ncbi:MAG TPA: hypothetical protein VE011_01355 [Candidatus Dormibacteraeota bacterium]|nr:hypothetical protein [Candidatus Dormibacteraeota bacterium]
MASAGEVDRQGKGNTVTDGGAVVGRSGAGRPGGRGLRLAIGGLWVVLCALIVITLLTARVGGPTDPSKLVIVCLLALSFGSVGAVLLVRLPGNRIGWLLAAVGFAVAAGISSAGLADQGLNIHPGLVPGALWLAWLSQWASAPVQTLVVGFLPLLFPTGRLPSRRWWPLAVLGGIGIGLSVAVNAVGPFTPGAFPAGIENPLLAPASIVDALSAANGAVGLLGIPGLLLILASVVLRYRSASGIERQQVKWFAGVAAVAIVCFAVGNATAAAPAGSVLAVISSSALIVAFVAILLMPVAIGMAVLRYRLYDIDLVIRRTAVYVPLTAILAGIYAASVGLLQRLFVAATGNPSDGAVVLSTLILATTFTPIKNALQGAVDRRFRDTQDIDRRLERFTASVAEALAADPARTMRAFLRVAVDASGAAGGRAYLGSELVGNRSATVATPRDVPAVVVTISLGPGWSGRLELDPHPSGRPYSARERNALAGAAVRLAVALDVVRPPSTATAGLAVPRPAVSSDGLE